MRRLVSSYTPFSINLRELRLYQNGVSPEFIRLKVSRCRNVIPHLKNLSFESTEDSMIFLFNLSKDSELSTKFIDEIISKPKDTYNIINILLNIIGGDHPKSLLELWLNDESFGYKYAYIKYFKARWAEATDYESLVKLSPNITPWALGGKSDELERSFTLGSIPEDFGGNIDTYRKLILKLLKTKFYKDYIRAKNSEYNKNAIKAFGIKLSDTIAISNKINEQLQAHNNKPFNLDGYTITPIVKSFSQKLTFSISINGNRYFLKVNPYFLLYKGKTDFVRKNLENTDLRSDMPYSNALIDFYLKLNNSSNAADILFYDHVTDSILYGASTPSNQKLEISQTILNNVFLASSNPHFLELQKLGIFLNDINAGNFIITTEGRTVLIDSGHAVYNHPFRPMVPGYHYSLGNLCGREELILPVNYERNDVKNEENREDNRAE